MENKKNVSQPNALLTFAGEQDVTAFGVVCAAIEDHFQEESGGSRELSVRCENGNIVIGYKKNLDV